MNAPRPRLSVIMATYNQDRYIAEAIQSILDQDFDDVEVIVVNDGSTDRTSEVVDKFGSVIQIYQDNLGQGAAVNNGILHARGGLITFLDSDDLLEPGTLAKRVARFDDDPDLDYSQGMVIEFRDPDSGQASSPNEAHGLPAAGPLSGTTMVRRDVLDRVGMMRTDAKLGTFMEWLMRARDLNLTAHQHREVLLRRRLHDDNIGTREPGLRTDYVRLLKLSLDRRRKSGQIESRDS